jgi:hypothetical protein
MVSETAEDAMRRACEAILRGDLMAAMQDLSPEAFNEAMQLGADISMLPTPQSYTVESREVIGNEHRYVARFKTSAQDIVARASWRQIDGAWKITSIAADGLRQQ